MSLSGGAKFFQSSQRKKKSRGNEVESDVHDNARARVRVGKGDDARAQLGRLGKSQKSNHSQVSGCNRIASCIYDHLSTFTLGCPSEGPSIHRL